MNKLIPRKLLFGSPVKSEPRISPDGKRIAYLASFNNVSNIWVKTPGLEDDRVVTTENKRDIYIHHFWAHDNRHIMYIQDEDGNENFNLFRVNIETGETVNLTPYKDVQVRGTVSHFDKNFPGELLIEMNKENPELHDVYRLDLTSGSIEPVAKNPGNVVGWRKDTNLNIRGAIAARDDGGLDLLVRKDNLSEWKKLASWGSEDYGDNPWVYRMVGFSADGQHIFLRDPKNSNTCRLVKMNTDTGEVSVVAEDPHYDVEGTLINPDTYEIQAVMFAKERREWLLLDKTLEEDFKAIKGLDRGDFSIINRDYADKRWLISFTKDNGPVTYYSYDRITKEGTFLFSEQPALNDYTLAIMEPVSFTARDGLKIHGYITFPPGKERVKLPLVLKVHGGPWHRDNWGYDPEAQLFASRGYACFQINFRGSTGYGKDFLNAGDKELGGKMQDDLTDGVKWAIDEGIADPRKIAIYGRSYGGYAALVGATSTPDLFCCAVSAYGMTSLITFLENIPPYWASDIPMFIKKIGNPETEREFLKSRSPLFRVDAIKIPVLIAHGAKDVHVKQSEAEQIVEVMKNKGIAHEYILFPDEGHGFTKPENRIKFYKTMEKFLAEHLGGRCE